MADLSTTSDEDLKAALVSRGFRVVKAGDDWFEDFDDDELLREIALRGYDIKDEDDEYRFEGDLEEARARLMRGDIRECLIQLERALPEGFSGLAERIFGCHTYTARA